MRVLAVAQGLPERQVQPQRLCGASLSSQTRAQPGADRSVVARGVLEGLQGQLAAQLLGDGPGGQRLQKCPVLRRAGQHRHIGMVLGGGPHHGGATDVDVFNRRLPAHRRIGHGLPKGVEVDHDHIDWIDALGHQIGLVARIGPLGQDPPVDAGVQRFDPAAQDLGGAGVFCHLGDRQTCRREGRRRAAAREQPIAGRQQPLGEGHQPLLIGHTQQGRWGHGTAPIQPVNLRSNVPAPAVGSS